MQTGAKTQTAQQLKKKLREVMGATASYSSKSASRVVSRMCAG
jgi:hypothetical protein